MTARPRILVMGTPEIAKTILAHLHAQDFPIVAVFAQPDRPKGRGKKMQSPPVAEFAKEHNLPLFQPETTKDDSILQKIEELAPDYIVVAAYGQILPKRLLAAPKKECLNVHASLLPKYRGAAPINYCLLNGDDQTGVSIMRVVPKLDAGPVFLAESFAITDDMDAVTLTNKMAEVGAQALVKTLLGLEAGELTAVEQDESQVTYAHKLSREMSAIDWNKSARDIFNQVRALVPWPVAFATLEGEPLKVHKASVLNESPKGNPGEVVHISQKGWTVVCAEGALLLQDVQVQGKKRMSAFDVANGMRLTAPFQLG